MVIRILFISSFAAAKFPSCAAVTGAAVDLLVTFLACNKHESTDKPEPLSDQFPIVAAEKVTTQRNVWEHNIEECHGIGYLCGNSARCTGARAAGHPAGLLSRSSSYSIVIYQNATRCEKFDLDNHSQMGLSLP